MYISNMSNTCPPHRHPPHSFSLRASTSGRHAQPRSCIHQYIAPQRLGIARHTPRPLCILDRRPQLVTTTRVQVPYSHRRPLGPVHASAAASGISQQPPEQPPPLQHGPAQLGAAIASIPAKLRAFLSELDGLWGRFLPMCFLFFSMAFNNTILDSVKDSLVITAKGGGTQVIPFLTGT